MTLLPASPFLETHSSCGVAESRSEARAPSPPGISRLAQNVRGTGLAPGPQDRFFLDETSFMEFIENPASHPEYDIHELESILTRLQAA